MKTIISGIYCIKNKVDGKIYIGSSRDIYKRFGEHTRILKRNKHHSPKLQNAWNKHGKDVFEFIILEECCIEQLLIIEQKYLDDTKCYKDGIGYNIYKFTDLPSNVRGENHGGSKLTWEDIHNIRDKYNSNKNITCKELAAEFNITSPNVTSIIRNKTWIDPLYNYDYLNKRDPERHSSGKFIWQEINNIRKLYIDGYTKMEITDFYQDITFSAISSIIDNESWHDENYEKPLREKYLDAINKGITFEIACEIRKLYQEQDISYKNISKKFNTNKNMVRRIIINETWYDENYIYVKKENGNIIVRSGSKNKNAKFNETIIEQIRLEYNNGSSVVFLSKKYKVTYGTMEKIIKNKSWKDASYIRTRFP